MSQESHKRPAFPDRYYGEVGIISQGSRSESTTLTGVGPGLCEVRRTLIRRTSENSPSTHSDEQTFVGGAGNSNPEIQSMPLILNGLLEGLARLESRNLPGPYLHPLSGLRVFTFPRLLLPNVELPEARQLDLLAPLERLCYGRRESFQVFCGFALWRVGVFDHPLDQLLLVHDCFPPCSMMLTSLSPTLGRSTRKHARHRGSFVESRPSKSWNFVESPYDEAQINGLQAVGGIALIPELVRMQALPSVQQPCSNPSKSPEMLGKASSQKYLYLQAFCKVQKAPEISDAALAWRRSGVQVPSGPLFFPTICR